MQHPSIASSPNGVQPRSRWFNPVATDNTGRPSLFCFPHAGANAFVFEGWKQPLADTAIVRPVLLPGRGALIRVPAEKRMAPLVEGISRAIAEDGQRPFALFGHSMGALLAVNICRMLETEYGLVADHLFVSGRVPPKPGKAFLHPLHGLSDTAFIEKLRELRGMPEELLKQPEFLQLMLPTIRADFEVIEAHVWPTPVALAAPLTAITGKDDGGAPERAMRQWNAYSKSAFSLEVVKGGHFFVYEEAASVMRIIQRHLSLAGASSKR